MQSDEGMIGRLQSRWINLFDRIGMPPATNPEYPWIEFENLKMSYSEPQRAYHRLPHIDHCFSEFDEIKNLLENPMAVELAIWFHDEVYETNLELYKFNEERSIGNMFYVMKNLVCYDDLGEAACFIYGTKKHEWACEEDENYFLDIDLAILGQPEDIFDEYEKGIRFEFKHVPEKVFREKRIEILKSLLRRNAIRRKDKDSVYFTEYFRKKYDKQAVKNLKRSIARLSQKEPHWDDDPDLRIWDPFG